MPRLDADTLGPFHRSWRLPQLWWQGRRLRRQTVRLPEGEGPRHGFVAGAEPPLRVLVAGDSAAVAVGVVRQSEGLAPAIAAGLATRSGRGVHWRALGRSGLSACDFAAALPGFTRELEDGDGFDAIATSLGTNDAVGMIGSADVRHAMLAVAEGLRPWLRPGGRLVILHAAPLQASPLFPSPLRALVAWRIARIDALLADVAREADALYVAPGEGIGARDFACDGFHPGPRGYLAWGRQVADMLWEGPISR